ncbi:MAG: hypothetical protein ACTS7E_03955 [Arsenophonus sp. NC-CH8-MAG3]
MNIYHNASKFSNHKNKFLNLLESEKQTGIDLKQCLDDVSVSLLH